MSSDKLSFALLGTHIKSKMATYQFNVVITQLISKSYLHPLDSVDGTNELNVTL